MEYETVLSAIDVERIRSMMVNKTHTITQISKFFNTDKGHIRYIASNPNFNSQNTSKTHEDAPGSQSEKK